MHHSAVEAATLAANTNASATQTSSGQSLPSQVATLGVWPPCAEMGDVSSGARPPRLGPCLCISPLSLSRLSNQFWPGPGSRAGDGSSVSHRGQGAGAGRAGRADQESLSQRENVGAATPSVVSSVTGEYQ